MTNEVLLSAASGCIRQERTTEIPAVKPYQEQNGSLLCPVGSKTENCPQQDGNISLSRIIARKKVTKQS